MEYGTMNMGGQTGGGGGGYRGIRFLIFWWWVVETLIQFDISAGGGVGKSVMVG